MKLILTFGLIFTSSWAVAIGSIAGVVRDHSTNQPLVGAEVVVWGSGRGTQTDESGRYRIDSIPIGQYSVEASLIGYRSLTKTRVTILSRRVVDLDFELEQAAVELPGITVRPDYFPKERSQATSSTEFDYHEVRTDPEGYNLPRVLSSLPGVATDQDYSAAIIVRGGSPDENLTILDNVEIPNPSHFPELGGGGGVLTIINTDLVRDVTFSSGGFPARFGNKLSSFLNIEPRDGNREHFEALFDLSMVGLTFILEGPILNKATYSLCYRKSFLEVLDWFSDIGDVIPYYDDYYARFTFEPRASDKFSLLNIWTKDHLTVPRWSPNLGNDLVWQGWMAITGFNWSHIIGNHGFLRTTLSRNALKNHLKAEDEFDYTPEEESYLASTDLHYRLTKAILLETGVQVGFWSLAKSVFSAPYRLPTGDSVPGVNTSDDTTAFRTAVYLQTRIQPLSFLTIMPGLRYDYLTLNRQGAFSPRLGLSLSLLPNTTLNLAYGDFYQPPSFFTMMSEPELKFKKAVHYIAGIEQLVTPSLRLSIEGYYKVLSHLPVPGSREPNAELDSVGTGMAKGVEFFLHQKLSKNIYGKVSYSYGFSERADWRGSYPMDWDQRHILTVIGGYQLTKSMDISLKFRYASGRPYTPYDTLAKFQDPETKLWFCPESDKINSAFYPAYSRLDFQCARTDHFGPVTFTGYINIQNVLNRRNVYNYWWDTEDGTLKPNYQFYRMIVGGFRVAF